MCQVLENAAENWELLLEGFLEYRARAVSLSGVPAIKTPEIQKNLAIVLKKMVSTINGPIVIAWDTQRTKVNNRYFTFELMR